MKENVSSAEQTGDPGIQTATDQKQALIDYLSGFINTPRRQLLQQILADRTRYLTVVLEDIYYPQNASAVLRSCECLGIQELHVIENRNRYQLNPDVVRGAAKWVDLKRYNNPDQNNTGRCLQQLRQAGYKIAAMTPAADGIELDALPIAAKIALCFGTEETGLSASAVELADYEVKIPMCGFTRSFNLSVSAGISLYSLLRRLRGSDVNWHLSKEDQADLYIDWLVKSTPTGRQLKLRFLEQYPAS